jgi:NifU-like protein involved in Fe-S cluster formation
MLTSELEKMCIVKTAPSHGAAPIPEEGRWVRARDVADISGFAHGCGTCAPQMGTSKLTLNVKAGVIQEALIENIGCSGMTQSSAMAAEILPGKTIIEALNTDLVCDAINSAMKALFLQIVYGRTQTSFSDGGLPIGAAWEDLGAGACSQVGTAYGTLAKGPRYLEVTGGYVTRLALDEDREIIGYEYVHIGRMMDLVAKKMSADEAMKKSTSTYGRFAQGVTFINPRHE